MIVIKTQNPAFDSFLIDQLTVALEMYLDNAEDPYQAETLELLQVLEALGCHRVHDSQGGVT